MNFKRQQEIADLLGKYLKEGEVSSEEEKIINEWIDESETNKAIWNRLTDPDYVQQSVDRFWTGDKEVAWQNLINEISAAKDSTTPGIISGYGFRIRTLMRYAAVFTGLLFIGGMAWLMLVKKQSPNGTARDQSINNQNANISTNSYVFETQRNVGAKLVMADGQTIYLNNQSIDELIEKDGTRLESKTNELIYASTDTDAKPVFNTLIIPRGSVYQLRLSDGTEVSLNSGSTLRYPTRFGGKNRQVYLSGEAYFDVAHDEGQPFVVTAGQMDITVLGTRFNVSSYPEDAQQKTTLFQGAVKISEKGRVNKEVLLKPGYEAILQKEEGEIVVNKIKDKGKPGWKENMLVFENESLGNIMNKLSREYNIKVIHKEGVDSSFHFTGRIKMGDDLKDLIELIEMTGKVKFKIINNELWVLPAEAGE